MDPIETSELAAFARSVETLSLSRAAAELGLPRATLSRRLARLETRLGVRLLRRTTRRITVTDAGTVLYQHARTILAAVRDAEASVSPSGDAVRGRLRVSVPPMMPTSFMEMVMSFMSNHPDVRMELQVSARHVDLVAEGYDVALRAGSDLAPGLVGRTLLRERVVAVASPAYLRECGLPRTLRDLARHRCITAFTKADLPQTHWPLRRGGVVHVESVLACNELDLIAAAAVRGRGIALLPMSFARVLAAKGLLRTVLERVVGTDVQVMVVYAERELLPAATRAFVDAIFAWGQASLNDNGILERTQAFRT